MLLGLFPPNTELGADAPHAASERPYLCSLCPKSEGRGELSLHCMPLRRLRRFWLVGDIKRQLNTNSSTITSAGTSQDIRRAPQCRERL